MGKMKNLHAQGVTDIESYLIGRANQREEIVEMISQSLNNPVLELEKLTPRMALAVVIGAIQWNGEVETQATKDEDTQWISNT
jgi:hypothetical protein